MTLFEAVQAGDVASVKKALKSARDLNELGEGGRTPLIEAARVGRADLVKLLLEAGAEPSLEDDEKETALLKAAANGHAEIAAALSIHATEDQRAMAHAYLKAKGKIESPDYQPPQTETWKKVAASASARVSKFVGHDEPAERLARADRAEQNAKKRR
jgi:ankyrin repeat protein